MKIPKELSALMPKDINQQVLLNQDSCKRLTMIGSPCTLSLLSEESAYEEMGGLKWSIEEGDADIYWLYSSEDTSLPEDCMYWLDVEKYIMIADNNNEDMIVLDFRFNEESPAVLAFSFDGWVKIADTVGEFVIKYL